MPQQEFITKEMRSCIDSCIECFTICTETTQHCLATGGEHAEKGHIALLEVCADICQTASRAMLRGAPIHAWICAACAEVCEACASDCEALGGVFMDECAAVCRECAGSCRSMAGGAGSRAA